MHQRLLIFGPHSQQSLGPMDAWFSASSPVDKTMNINIMFFSTQLLNQTQTDTFVRRTSLEGTFPQILQTCYYISIGLAGGSVPLPSRAVPK